MFSGSVYAKVKEDFINAYKAMKGGYDEEKFIKDFYDNAIRAMSSFNAIVGVDKDGMPDANLDGLIIKFVNATPDHAIDLSKADEWFKVAIAKIKNYIKIKEYKGHKKDEEDESDKKYKKQDEYGEAIHGLPRSVIGYEIYSQINGLSKEERKKIDEDHPLFHLLMKLDDPFYLVLHVVNNLGKRLDQAFDKDEARRIFENLYKKHSDFAVRYARTIIDWDLVKDLIGNDVFAFNRLRHIIDNEHVDQASKYVRYYRTLRRQFKNEEEADNEIWNRFLGAMHINNLDELTAESIHKLGGAGLARLAIFLAPGVLAPEHAIKVRNKLGRILNGIEEKIVNDEKLSEAEKSLLDALTSLGIIDATRKPNLVKSTTPKERLEGMFKKIIDNAQSIDEALDAMAERYNQFVDNIKKFDVDIKKIFYDIPAAKFKADWIIIPALKNHPILNIPEFKEAIHSAIIRKDAWNEFLNRLKQIIQKGGNSKMADNLKMIEEKLYNAYGIKLLDSDKANLSNAIMKAATIIKNLKNLPTSIINQIELEFVAMGDDFKAAYASLAMDIGHKPINALTSIKAKDEKRMRRIASSILQLAINAGATQLARHAAKWVDPFEHDEEMEDEEMQRIVDPYGDPLEHLVKEWSNRFIPLAEIGDVQYFIDVATYKILKQEGDEPGLKPVINRNEIKKILNKIDINKVNKLASAIQGVDLQLDRAQGFYNLVPLFKYSQSSNPGIERRIMFSPSDGTFYAFEVDKKTGQIIKEFPPTTTIPRNDLNLLEKFHNIKNQVVGRIKESALKHFYRYKNESKLVVEDEPTLIYADNNNIIYYFKGSLYKLDLSNFSHVRLNKGEAAEFKDYLYYIKPIKYEKYQKRKEGYDLIDSAYIPGLRVAKFDIYQNPRTKELKAKYFNSDLDAPTKLQNAIINKYLNLPELAKNNIFEIGGKKYIVTYDPKLKKYYIRDYNTKQYIPSSERKEVLKYVRYKKREYKLPNGKTIIIGYDPLDNSYFIYDEETSEIIKNNNILRNYFKENTKKEVYFDNSKYIVYFDPIENRYVVTYEDGREVQSEKFKNKILREIATREHIGDFYYVGEIEKIGEVYYYPLTKEFFVQKNNELTKADYVLYKMIMDYIKENNIKLPNPPIDIKFSESKERSERAIREKIEETVQGILSSINEKEISDAFDYIIREIILSKSAKNVIKNGVVDFFVNEKKKINKKNIEDIVNFLIDRLNLKKYNSDYLGNLLMFELLHRNKDKIYKILNSVLNVISRDINVSEEVKTEMKNLNKYVKELYTSFLNSVDPERRNVYSKTLDDLMPKIDEYHEITFQFWKPLALAFLMEGLREKAYSFVESVNFEQEIKKRVELIVNELIANKIIIPEEQNEQ